MRLEDYGGGSAVISYKEFQFQTGAIRSYYDESEVLDYAIVSIPNWCD